MKKIIFLVVCLLVMHTALAYTVGYVVSNPSSMDSRESALKSFLSGDGNSVSVLDDTTTTVTAYDIVIVSHTVSDIRFDHQHTKTLFMSTKAAKKKGFGASSGSTSGTEITIDKSHFITDGYSLGGLKVYNSQDSMNYLLSCFPSNSKNLAYKSSNTRSLILVLDTNALLLDETSPDCSARTKKIFERNLFFGLTETDKWNTDAKNLFRQSLVWVATGGMIDMDSDGRNSIESGGDDCNDNDATVYPNAADINKNCKNDAPVITAYAPTENKILKDTSKEFSVSASDDETSALAITWKIDSVIVGTGAHYTFNKPIGDYTVEASVSDGSLTTKQIWYVEVRDSTSFSCSQIGGYTCATGYICEATTYPVNDLSLCCSIVCAEKPLEFSNAKHCTTKNNDIDIAFDELSDDDFYIGDTLDFAVEIENQMSKRLTFDTEISVYDATKQDESMKKIDSTKIDSHETGTIRFENELAGNLREDNIYALYVYTETEEGQCNEAYYKIDVKRKESQIVIDYLDFEDQHYVCGDAIEFEIGATNIGTITKDVFLKIKNNELDIDEETDEMRIEAYGEDDSESGKIIATIPNDAKAGTYTITAEAEFNTGEATLQKTLTLDECRRISQIEEKIQTITIGTGTQLLETLSLDSDESSFGPYWIIAVVYLALFVFGIVISFIFLRKK